MLEIDWESVPNAQLIELGKWLYWAEEWATMKAQTTEEPFPRNAWRDELRLLLYKQEALRAAIAKRKLPLRPHEPSYWPQGAVVQT